jgi:hypothetical protein
MVNLMAGLQDVLFALADVFVWHPDRALAVAALLTFWFLILVRSRRTRSASWPLMLTAFAWALFAYGEYVARQNRSNIRVDLLVTWPGLLVLSLGAAGWAVYVLARSAGGAR